MSEAEQIAKLITLTRTKFGSLRFWGDWFGRPYDNCHRIVACSATADVLKLTFDQQETLQVWNPLQATVNQKTFQILQAERVRWEWYYYGRAKVAVNLCFEDFTMTESGVAADTNIDWYTPAFEFDVTLPAVEIL